MSRSLVWLIAFTIVCAAVLGAYYVMALVMADVLELDVLDVAVIVGVTVMYTKLLAGVMAVISEEM